MRLGIVGLFFMKGQRPQAYVRGFSGEKIVLNRESLLLAPPSISIFSIFTKRRPPSGVFLRGAGVVMEG